CLGAPPEQYSAVHGIGEGELGDEDQCQREIHRVEEVAPCEHRKKNQDERQVHKPVDAPRGGYDQMEIEIVVGMRGRHAGPGLLTIEQWLWPHAAPVAQDLDEPGANAGLIDNPENDQPEERCVGERQIAMQLLDELAAMRKRRSAE